jgi:hypothetical protein
MSAGNLARRLKMLVPSASRAARLSVMAAPAHSELHGSARLVDRALRAVEESTHSLRQRLLARKLGQTVPSDHWTATASDEPGLAAEDLRRQAAELRRQAG